MQGGQEVCVHHMLQHSMRIWRFCYIRILSLSTFGTVMSRVHKRDGMVVEPWRGFGKNWSSECPFNYSEGAGVAVSFGVC
jgi:hypothetical protein